MTEPTTVLVVSFDRWPWPALGCYGHEWIDTPAWDQLAAEGFVFDRCVATVDRDRRASAELWNDFLPRWRLAGHRTTLFRESTAAQLGPATLWDASHVITGNPDPAAPLAEQPFAQVAQAAITELKASPTTSRLVWVHGVGLPERCPVSRAALDLYAADFAEEGLRLASMTDEELADHELTRATTLSVLDHWLGEIFESARSLPGRKLLTVFAWGGAIWEPAPRPTPLIAPFDPQESQVPWIIAGDHILPGRTNALVTTDDLYPSLCGWAGVRNDPESGTTDSSVSAAKRGFPRPVSHDLSSTIAGDLTPVRRSLICSQNAVGAIWTPDDFLCFAEKNALCPAQRFLWPEDQWAVHDVADQTPGLTESRIQRLQRSQLAGGIWTDSLESLDGRPEGDRRPRS